MADAMKNKARSCWIVLAAVVIGAALYTASFFWLRYSYFPNYLLSNLLKPHPEIKPHPNFPVYAVAYYPLRWLAANKWSLTPKEPTTYVGKIRKLVREVQHNSIDLNSEGSYTSIGFICEPDVCLQLDGVQIDDLVEVQFGTALDLDNDRFIYKLLAVRKCENQDSRCDAGRAKQRQRDLEREQAMEASEKKWRECHAAMNATLLADPRYVQPDKSEQGLSAFNKYNAMTGEKKSCVDIATKNHTRAVFDSCTKHHCGDGIGGGCAHIAGRIEMGVLTGALQQCGAK